MIKDLIKECVVNSQLGVSDLVEYCDVQETFMKVTPVCTLIIC